MVGSKRKHEIGVLEGHSSNNNKDNRDNNM